jgi:hypothetical protein
MSKSASRFAATLRQAQGERPYEGQHPAVLICILMLGIAMLDPTCKKITSRSSPG